LESSGNPFIDYRADENLRSGFEAGFFAGTVFYLTLFYTRGELGFRIAIFFGSALLAAAFSGLISYGVFQINDPHVQGWKWLFIIEGFCPIFTLTLPREPLYFKVLTYLLRDQYTHSSLLPLIFTSRHHDHHRLHHGLLLATRHT
jgi:MFS family permease